jgi:hypothetical protein
LQPQKLDLNETVLLSIENNKDYAARKKIQLEKELAKGWNPLLPMEPESSRWWIISQ